VGKIRQVTMFRDPKDQTASLVIGKELQLDILVENVGRVSDGYQ